MPMCYIILALYILSMTLLWCCLRASQEPEKMEPQEPEPKKFAHEAMDLRLPEKPPEK